MGGVSYMLNNPRLNRLRTPKTLVENRVCFAGPHSELNIYDTYLPVDKVELAADQVLYCGMLTGRKIMYGQNNKATEFLPHESFVIAPGEKVAIDFPEASHQTPTTCLTIEISEQRLSSISDSLNKACPAPSALGEWHYNRQILHTHHTQGTQSLLERLVNVFSENHPDRNMFIDMGISELVIRLLRQQGRDFLLAHCRREPDAHGVAAVIAHIEQHLDQALDVDDLCRSACMSRSRLYAEFKKQLGCSPGEFQQQMRMQRAVELLNQGRGITEISYEVGYQNPSHFSRRFRRQFGCSPRQYQQRQHD